MNNTTTTRPRLHANGAIAVPNRETRWCTVCGRSQFRERHPAPRRCLYCGGPLFPQGYHAHYCAWTFPCPSIYWHHLMAGLCPTCEGRDRITLFASTMEKASAVYLAIFEFGYRNRNRGDVVRRYGESQKENNKR